MFSNNKIADFNNFLKKINYGYSILNIQNFKELDDQGYTLIKSTKDYWLKNKIDFKILQEISDNLCEQEGKEGGWENGKLKGINWEPSAQRISNLSNKNDIFIKISKLPDILNGVNYVIKKPFKISSLQIRNPLPFSEQQELHIDWRPRLFNYYNYNQCTAFIYLDNANKENGSINIYPGTHKILGNPNKNYIKKNNLKPIVLDAEEGNILILNIFTWHFGGKNLNGKKRKTIFVNYRERSELQQLNQKKFLDQKVKSRMSEFEKYLYAIRDKDKTESNWIYKYRNNKFLKLYLKTRDIIYHKFL